MMRVTAAMMREHNYELLREKYGEGTYEELVQKARDNWKRYKKEHNIGEFDWRAWEAKKQEEDRLKKAKAEGAQE